MHAFSGIIWQNVKLNLVKKNILIGPKALHQDGRTEATRVWRAYLSILFKQWYMNDHIYIPHFFYSSPMWDSSSSLH